MIRRTYAVSMLVMVLLLGGIAATARADDAADPTGDWSWTFMRGDREIEILMTLKVDGQTLTGTVGREDRRSEIEEGTFEDGKVAFKTVRKRGDRTFTMHYGGTVEADSIKGKIEFEIRGEKREFPWEAKRVLSLPVEREANRAAPMN